MSQYDPMFEFKINVGHIDLYYMVQWFCLILKTIWVMNVTNAPGKAKKPSISLPDIKVLMLFQVTDENNMWKQFVLQFLWISSPPSFFFYQEKL